MKGYKNASEHRVNKPKPTSKFFFLYLEDFGGSGIALFDARFSFCVLGSIVRYTCAREEAAMVLTEKYAKGVDGASTEASGG